MPQSTLSSASVSMSQSKSLTIARLGIYLRILGLVAAHLNREDSTCQTNGEYCQMHSDCCSRKCMTYLNVCARRIDEGFALDMPYLSNSIYDHDVMEFDNKFPDTLDIVTLPNDPRRAPQEEQGRQCKPVGGPCNVSEECCTKRCHFYMHRCVT
ncbi:uncharacterized protein LOC111073272 [Drosophila obscura]|uniref:uncharacterized protein LOC111073272 n=1 Tax=Drosophila obscura TaxID=7282 RepID=UPI001BB19218|nr:uncharacterized protein LOC111073272 [Drosophila obscura]